jgi:hypothetical protein
MRLITMLAMFSILAGIGALLMTGFSVNAALAQVISDNASSTSNMTTGNTTIGGNMTDGSDPTGEISKRRKAG